jgi:hypothetical protein
MTRPQERSSNAVDTLICRASNRDITPLGGGPHAGQKRSGRAQHGADQRHAA